MGYIIMNIDNTVGNGSFSEAVITVAGVTYYGLEDLLRRFDEKEFSNHYGIVDKKTNKNVNPREFLWVWIQKELQKEWDETTEIFNVTDEEMLSTVEEYYK